MRTQASHGNPLPTLNVPYEKNLIFRYNMQVLAQRYPEIVNTLDKAPGTGDYEMVQTKKGLPTFRIRSKGFFYYDVNDPMEDIKSHINGLKLKNARMAVFLGFGLGYEAFYYGENLSSKQGTNEILIIEKDPMVFLLALRTVDITPLLTNPKIHFIVGVPVDNLYTAFRSYLSANQRFYMAKAIGIVYYHSALRLNKEYYMKAVSILRESSVHQIVNFGNDPEDSLVGIQNMMDNIGEIIDNPGINMLFDKFAGKPAVIVATGPSLDKNKHLLFGIENKALIIAADASLKILLAMGFKPHMVTSLERIPETVELFNNIPDEDLQQTYFAACPVLVHESYEAYTGPKIIVYRDFDHFRWLGVDRGILNIKLSAGNMAFKVADALGCDPIILIGQDLAFTRDLQTNAEGTTHGYRQDSYLKENRLEVMGNDGMLIPTSASLYSFLKSYEIDIACYKGTCINSTEGGAYITGTQVMPFKDAIDKYLGEDFHPLDIIKRNLAAFTPENRQNDMRFISERIDKTLADMDIIVQNCKDGMELCEKHKDILLKCMGSPDKVDEWTPEIEHIGAEIVKQKTKCMELHDTWQLFLAHVLQSYHIKFEVEMYQLPEKYDAYTAAKPEILIRQMEWFAYMGDMTMVCRNMLIKARDKFHNTKNEGDANG